MTDLPASISDLQSKWDELSDLERGRAIQAIHLNGTSFRQLAKTLGRSPTLLRHLHQAAQAPPGDQNLARQGNVSTRELVRRAKAARLRKAAREEEALQLKRNEEAINGCRLICDWLEDEGIEKGLGEQIILEARRMLALADQKGRFPKHPAPPGTKPAEIIRLAAPSQALRDAMEVAALYGAWLTRWAWYAFPDAWVRDAALDLALDEQPRRVTPVRRHPLALDPNDLRIR